MTSSSALCTLAGARLISSASSRLPNTGPSSVSKLPVSGRQIRVPTRSAGTRSGVNWTRRNEPPRTWASVRTVSVLARPGTPSSSTWPPASRATSRRSSIASWPTMTRLTSCSASWSVAFAAPRSGVGSWNSFTGSFRSDQPAEPAQGQEGADQEQDERPAREAGGDLALGLAVAELRAEVAVHRAQPVGGRGGVGLPARGPGDLAQRGRVGRHALGHGAGLLARAGDGDRPVLRAEGHRVDGDVGALGLAGGDLGVDAARGAAVGEEHNRRGGPLPAVGGRAA